ncbi:hypothetical protein [Bergeyella sp. RCAD1439]|uniref:hypothetical protein n=1 Tax=Bergeyella anatis TaxID=3113737 RepID=UPI002E179702|nr:hypothetical protein [Bergeyella sp. RCAD1439]
MMNKIINKLVLGVFAISFALLSAQQSVSLPPELNEEATGGPGTPVETPIDMYEGALLVIGLAFIFYFVSRYYRKRVA